MSEDSSTKQGDLCHLYIDEAGTPDIFDAKGRVNIGKSGCSRFFLLGMLEVANPPTLAEALKHLRESMIADPYFASAESFKPERKKTALLLHAKDDLPEARVKVFDLLRSFGSDLRFRAVVCDKEAIRIREVKKREASPGYRYDPDALYDELARSLLGKFSRMADGYHLMIAKRGNRDRNAALLGALEQAEADFTESFGFSRGGIDAWQTVITNPRETICLQAADYFLWALQRFYEPRIHPETGEITHEVRYLNAVWPQVSQIHDLHFGPTHGTFFTPSNPLTLESRFGPKPPKKKKPHV
jgi:hypothetical protein